MNSSLSSTAEEILMLVGREARHPDPKVARAILKTDIEDAIHCSEFGRDYHRQVFDLDYENRQNKTIIDDLEDRIAELESCLEEAERRIAILESNP